MATTKLSAEERSYIVSGIVENFRADGRSRRDFRNFEFKKNVISNTNGSVQLQLGGTSVLVGVKAELDSPSKSAPDTGRVQFFVDCSALASPEFEGRDGEELGAHLSQVISNAYSKGGCIDQSSLCVVPGRVCWNLYIDALVIEWGGSVLDALGLAILAALRDTKLPKLEKTGEGEEVEIEVVNDPTAHDVLRVDDVPLIVTLTMVEDEFVIDATSVEEMCCSAQMIFSIDSNGHVCSIAKAKPGGIPTDLVLEGIVMAQETGKKLFKQLTENS